MYKYLVLGIAVWLMYYLTFKYQSKSKHEKRWRTTGYAAAIGGMLGSIGFILEEQFPASATIIGNILVIPVFVSIFAMFYFLIKMAWPLRKDPEKKVIIYTAFTIFAIVIIGGIVVFILDRLGVYG